MKEFEALKAILDKDNWEEELESRAITIKWDIAHEFFLLKYNQLASDFNDPATRACRGIIFDGMGKPFKCVCMPFVKFGNYGESYCPEIDWSSARVLQKIDGSLMKAWYYDGGWHLSTNGTIDAYTAEVNDFLSFGQLFDKVLGRPFVVWARETLDPSYTYMFELTSLDNRVVIEYKESKIWFLSRRNMKTLQEDYINDTGLDRPKQMDLHKLETCLSVVAQMSKDEEGVVVNDCHFNRIKIKSSEYLIAAHLINNRAITTKRIINMIKDLSIDDFLAYCNEYTETVNSIQDAFKNLAARWENGWLKVKDFAEGAHTRENRAAFAKIIHRFDGKSFFFHKYDYPDDTAIEYLLTLNTKTLKNLIEKEL